uniref:DNA-directed primase/polymerase protein n=1 Tax=Ditylenchus dipsaci TaxID=166011 RepID=A0A915DTC0_9BILA
MTDTVPDISQLLRRQFVIDHRQQDAVLKLKKDFPNARVFAFESPKFKTSCRKFLADDLRKFYLWYRSCDARCRHFYEIILENMPCRLYFDLEYYKEFNENIDAEATLDKFLNLCCRCMSDLLGYELDRSTSFLILDSSTPSKFSAHVIVHMPKKKLFPSNVALKPLVKRICQQMIIEDVGIIKEADGTSKFLCDLSVYSRNRNFRLFLSSKCGKDAILKLADYCTFYEDLSPVSNAQIFLDALIIQKTIIYMMSSTFLICLFQSNIWRKN